MDLLECAVCLGDMSERSPRSLHCLHCFCTECLTKLIKNGSITCPTCREITQLTTGNVAELKVDFKLVYFKDAMKKEGKKFEPKPRTKPNTSNCDICNGNDRLFKCKDCPQILCHSCRVKHDRISQFKSHTILELCMKHQDDVTYLCMKCVLPLCMKCMFLEHSSHDQYFIPYTEGKKEKQTEAKLLQDDIKKMLNQRKGNSELEEIVNISETMDKKFQKRKEVYLQKAAEIDRYVEENQKYRKQIKDVITSKEAIEAESMVAVASLNSLLTDSEGFCERYNQVKQKAEETREKLRKVFAEYSFPAYDVGKPCNCNVVVPRVEPKIHPPVLPIQNLKVECMMWNIKSSDKWKIGADMAVMDNDVLAINNNETEHVVRLDQAGKAIGRYHPNRKGTIAGMDVYDNNLFILQDDIVTKISLSDRNIIRVFNHGVKSSADNKMLVKDNNTIYVSVLSEGKIYQYDVLSNRTKFIVQGLKFPFYMSRIFSSQGNCYVITENDAHSILVYTEQWTLKHRISGSCSLPWATAITDMNTILLADYGNDRVSHYTMDGRQLTHVVTKEHGLKYVHGLSYKHPFLYICSRSNYIKCYKLKYV